jgi:hypothetical protein
MHVRRSDYDGCIADRKTMEAAVSFGCKDWSTLTGHIDRLYTSSGLSLPSKA